MKNIKQILVYTFGLFLVSCTTTYYIPNSHHVPVINEKGQTKLTVAGNTSQAEFQAAYGLGENVGIMADGVVVFPQNEENGNGGSGNMVDLGVGYFKPVSETVLFDTYAIIGFGKMENHFPTSLVEFPNTTGDISANLFRYGVQPSISYHSTYFSATGSARIVNLTYSNVDGSLIYNDENQVQYLKSNNSNFLIEPGITLRGGIEKVKLQLQYVHSFNLSNSSFPYTKDLITLGLNFNF